jgi:hypothetical protein
MTKLIVIFRSFPKASKSSSNDHTEFEMAIDIHVLYLFIFFIHGFGGLEVACWPLVSKFAGSNTAEAVGFLRAKKSSARLPSEGK